MARKRKFDNGKRIEFRNLKAHLLAKKVIAKNDDDKTVLQIAFKNLSLIVSFSWDRLNAYYIDLTGASHPEYEKIRSFSMFN